MGKNMFMLQKNVFWEILASVVDIYAMFIFNLIYVLRINDYFKCTGFRKQTAIQERWI